MHEEFLVYSPADSTAVVIAKEKDGITAVFQRESEAYIRHRSLNPLMEVGNQLYGTVILEGLFSGDRAPCLS